MDKTDQKTCQKYIWRSNLSDTKSIALIDTFPSIYNLPLLAFHVNFSHDGLGPKEVKIFICLSFRHDLNKHHTWLIVHIMMSNEPQKVMASMASFVVWPDKVQFLSMPWQCHSTLYFGHRSNIMPSRYK